MIPLPSALLARLIGGAVIAAGLTWAVLTVVGWRDDSAALESTRKDLADERISHQRELALLRESYDTQIRNAHNASRAYQDELASLRASRPARPVRLCTDSGAAPSATAGDHSPTTGPDGTSPAPGMVPAEAGRGRDIGPDLFAVADRADELAAQLRGLQAWAKGVASQK